VSPRYSLDIGSFLIGKGQGPPESSVTHTSNDKSPLAVSFPPTTLDAVQVSGASLVSVEESSLNIPSSDSAPSVTLCPPAVPDAGQVSGAALKKVAFSISTPRASHKGKVSD